MEELKQSSQLYLKSGQLIQTDCPIIYSGDYLLITHKTTSMFGDVVMLTSETRPYHFNDVLRIVTNQPTKKYPKYEK